MELGVECLQLLHGPLKALVLDPVGNHKEAEVSGPNVRERLRDEGDVLLAEAQADGGEPLEGGETYKTSAQSPDGMKGVLHTFVVDGGRVRVRRSDIECP